MSWNSTLGLIALVSLSFPIILLIVLRLAAYRTFPALVFSLSFTFCYNLLTLGFFKMPAEVINNLNFWNNMLDAPLMLLFLTYFCATQEMVKKMKIVIVSLLAFEIAVIAIVGYNT